MLKFCAKLFLLYLERIKATERSHARLYILAERAWKYAVGNNTFRYGNYQTYTGFIILKTKLNGYKSKMIINILP